MYTLSLPCLPVYSQGTLPDANSEVLPKHSFQVCDLCPRTFSFHVQYLLLIQPLCLSVCSIVVDHHGSEHPRGGCSGVVLYLDSGDGGVGCPKVQESWEKESWKQDWGGAAWGQEYQPAGWDFHHDRYVFLWGSETVFCFVFLLTEHSCCANLLRMAAVIIF